METWDAIRARRNVRTFAERSVALEDLDRILEAGRRSPSSMNEQPWDFVAITQRARLIELAGIWKYGEHLAGAAAAIAFVAAATEDPEQREIIQFDMGQAAMSVMLAAADLAKPMTRSDVTELIVMKRIKKGLTWAKLAKAVGQSKEWTTAALLGQMQMTKEQAEAAGKLLGLPEYAVLLLQQVPYKGSLPTAVPTDPLIYRFYELVNVYGTTFKELIHEEFGDGIMSAIDFKMDLTREPDPKGDRVKIVMSGKYLQYKTY